MVFGSEIGKAYLGTDLVFQKASPQPQQHTLTKYPSSYDQNDYSYDSISNISRSYASVESTNYGQMNLVTGKNAESWMYFKFDTSSIPAGATIVSVSCQIKASISTTNSSVISARTIQLYSGTTAKGSSVNIKSVSSSDITYTLSGGAWTLEEASDVRFKVYARRGTSQASTSHLIRIYGATLTITYTI